MAILHAIIDSDKNKLFQVIKGVPQFDMGPAVTLPNSGIILDKVSNGYNYRYKPRAGQSIAPTSIFSTTVDNSVNTVQPIYEFTIPAGTINQGDTVELSFTQDKSAGSPYNLRAIITAVNEYAGVTGQMYRNTGVGGKVTISFTAVEAGIALVTGNGIGFTSEGGRRVFNTLSEIKVLITGTYTTAVIPATLTLTYSAPSLTFKPSAITNTILDINLYRKPDITPFHEDSFWNRQLSSTCVYGSSSHPMAVLLRDVRAGQSDKVNGIRKNIQWIDGPYISWTGVPTNGGIPVYQCSDSDPICNVTVVLANMPKKCGAWFSVIPQYSETINSVQYGVMQLKMPGGKLFAGQSGDAIVILISPDKRYAFEIGKYSYDTVKNRHMFSVSHVHDLYGYGHSLRYWPRLSTTQITSMVSPVNYGFQFGYRAGGMPSFAGLVRTEEMMSGVIPHMIGMQLDPILLRTSRVAVVSWDLIAKTFTIKPRTANTQVMDYSILFSAGTIVVHQGVTYTCTGTVSFDPQTYYTTFEVNEAIINPVVSSILPVENSTSIGTQMFLGGALSSQQHFDFRKQWPLGECDGGSDYKDGYNGIIPMGQVFAIPRTTDISTLGLTSSYSTIIAKAFQDYGAILNDITGNTFNVIQLETSMDKTIRALLFADLSKLVSALVPVTNYGPGVVQDSINDISLPKLLPLVPIY